MARKPPKIITPVLVTLLMGAGLWTYFQPAFEIQLSGFAARSWSAWDLSRSAAGSVSRFLPKHENKPQIKIEVKTDFTGFLKKLFPRRPGAGSFQPTWQQWAGFVLGLLIPAALALAYFCLLLSLAAQILHPEAIRRLSGITLLASIYALAGVFYLGREAEKIYKASLDHASHGILGLFSKSLVPEMSVHPALALYGLPVLAAAIFFLSCRKR